MLKAALHKLVGLALSHLDFLKKAFSDNGIPSSSRLLSIPHFLVSAFCALYTTIKTGGHPDAMAITALSGFAVAPYTVNRVSNMFGQKKDQDSGTTDVDKSKTIN